MNRVASDVHFARQKEGRKDKIVQGGDDDRELLSVSLTQSEQLYVCASYQSFSSPLSSFFFSLFGFCLFKDCSCRHLCVPYLVLCRTHTSTIELSTQFFIFVAFFSLSFASRACS